ncbi:MAG: SurA N-terminal domain-containing protein [Paludibacteraceae bacterium]|nr:SurA N-terminal domain-containing protein [Paludibacteraceae bacterium]
MATLERIRSKGIFLLVIIGLALLAFIVGDFLNSSSSWFRQSQENVVEIDGEVIKIQQYQELIDQLTEVYKIEYGMSNLDENTITQLRQSVWETLVRQNILNTEAEKIGLTVGAQEMKDLTIGNTPHQLVLGRRIFMNPQTGMFDKNRLIDFLKQLDKKPANVQEQEQLNLYKKYWMYFENTIKTGKLEEKYTVLINKALNANSLEAKMAYKSTRNTVDVLYVLKPYSAIADDKIKVTDDEIAAKYELIKERFKQENNRDVKFVSFNLMPSQQDFKKAQDWINNLKTDFSTTSDIASVVNPNSKPYNDVALSAKDIDSDLKDFAFSASKDAVFGPVLFGNTFKMARVMEAGISAPDSIKLRHIVVATQDSVKTKVLADSIMGALKSGADFASLAVKYSQMQESATKGGEIGWIPVAASEQKIITACLAQPINNYFTYKDGSAIQIIQVTEKTANVRKVKLAVITNEVNPSQDTYSKIYNEAKQFAANFNTSDKFEKGAQQKGYIVQPIMALDENAPTLAGVKNSRQVVRWAFEAEEAGVVSDVYDCEKQFVVATVTAINKKGYKELAVVKDEVKSIIIPDKKAKLIMDEINAKKAADITTLATQLALKVDSAKEVNFEGSSFGVVGYEPAVIAQASMSSLNKLSKPIQGKQGVYVLQAYKIFTNPVQFDPKMDKLGLTMRYANAAYGAIDALKEKSEIVDNRSRFY